MNKDLQETDDMIMAACLDKLLQHKSMFVLNFGLTMQMQKELANMDFPYLSEEMKARREKELSGLSEFFRECIKHLGGIPALVRFDKPGEGLLSDCMVIPTEPAKTVG